MAFCHKVIAFEGEATQLHSQRAPVARHVFVHMPAPPVCQEWGGFSFERPPERFFNGVVLVRDGAVTRSAPSECRPAAPARAWEG